MIRQRTTIATNVLLRTAEAAVAVLLFTVLAACKHDVPEKAEPTEDKAAKTRLQGIWVDADMQQAVMRVKGDTVFYPDTTSVPAYIAVVQDTLVTGHGVAKYAITKLTDNVLWFENQNGDIVKLHKSDDSADALAFQNTRPKVNIITTKTKSDTIVEYDGDRYHCYVQVNPTTYKVESPTYNDEGVMVGNVYYDNIINLTVYRGGDRLFKADLRKQMFSKYIPQTRLRQAVLSNIEFASIDSHGLHFNTTICIPSGASCYMLDTTISFDGRRETSLLSY